jgi:hypothetical protein
MGTRHIISAKCDGTIKLCQYGQWDGYPSGQGIDTLRQLKTFDMNRFKKKVKLLQFYDDKEIENKQISDGEEFNRDTGSKILSLIYNDHVIRVVNSEDAIAWIEYSYMVDFDENKLEAYSYWGKGNKEYLGLVLIDSFDLDNLPSEEEFLRRLEREEDLE